MQLDDRFMLSMALRGFHGAKIRFSADSVEDAFVPAAEAVYWACVLDEQMKALDPDRYGVSAALGARVMRGVRFARNVVTHRVPMTFHRTDGFQLPVTLPFNMWEIRWRAASELPEKVGANQPDDPRDGGRAEYMTHLSDRPVRITLDTIAGWFAEVQNWERSILVPGASDQDSFLRYARELRDSQQSGE